jgi:hypothetical protein
MMNSRLRFLLLTLSLLAVGGLIAVSGHGHADGDNHAGCWLCASSFGLIAVPGAVLVIFLGWTVLGHLVSAAFVCPDSPHRFSCSPRAPPA